MRMATLSSKWTTALVAVVLALWMAAGASAAPMFPDVPAEQWAHDAVASLAARGLLEGYSDGTFKGDRAASRWELALMVQRLLARMEADHALMASKADRDTVRALVDHLKDRLETLGVRIGNAEDRLSGLDRRVSELERIRFEGDVTASYQSVGIHNTGKQGTNWAADVGHLEALDFARNHKMGAIDLLNGRPLLNGSGTSTRIRAGFRLKLSEDVDAALRLAAYTSTGNPYLDAYWGVPAPYLANPFAANAIASGGAQGMNNQPWTRMVFDRFLMLHTPSKTQFTAGSIEETLMDSFVLQKVPNPNIHGKSMAAFSERVLTDRKQEKVVTLNYREDEDTYLPFFGGQVSGKARLGTDAVWEVMFSKLPFGANPTAGPGQPPVNNETVPYLYSGSLAWLLGDRGNVKLNYLSVRDSYSSIEPTPNVGNYFFWTDPISVAGQGTGQQPMRGNSFVSRQSQWSYGASVNYHFEPSYIRTVAEYGHSFYKPNADSPYTVNGTFWRLGAGWTNPANTLRVDAEYVATDPFYDPYQLYFNPVGNMALGGVAPGTPLAFSVVPLYYGGFPGSYVPFGYQLHDSGLYPNNRNGVHFSTEYRLPKERGRIELRGAWLEQNQPSTPHRDITGLIHGMPVGFIDTVFGPLNTNGLAVMETPRGVQSNLGGGFVYRFGPKLELNAQYDDFRFLRSTAFAMDTITAKKNYVNLAYNVLKVGLDYPVTRKMMLHAGYTMVGVRGYHPALNAGTYNAYNNTFVGVNAGTLLVDLTQGAPYAGFDFKISDRVTWNLEARYVTSSDHLADRVSPESFAGPQVSSEFKMKF